MAIDEQTFIQIAPSILSGNFGRLEDEAKRLEDAGADRIHIDIMDGHFVPNLTLGPKATAAIRRSTNLFLDVHLMIYNPFDYVERFVEAGANNITFHFEATEDVTETLNYIRKCNVKASLAFNPETSSSLAIKYLTLCDMILLMTVNPGFGGQAFIPDVLEKVQFLRETCTKLNIRQGGIVPKDHSNSSLAPFDIQVDGGVNLDNVANCTEAGANIIVAGTSLFKEADLKEAIKQMKVAATAGCRHLGKK